MSYDDKTLKKKISDVVKAYKARYPDDYSQVVKAIDMKRRMTKDQYAKIEGSDMRGMFELPEDLHTALIHLLEPDEMAWFKSLKGGRWFQKTFREFSLVDAGKL